MSLQDLVIKDEYRSDRCSLIEDFYLPCLENATLYSRAVGFFSSSSLIAVSQGLTALIRSGGKMRLVASPCLSAEDVEAIATGLKQREDVIAGVIVQELDQFEEVAGNRLACLAWLLSQGVLEIKLATPKDLSHSGIYHEKLGIFADNFNIIAFTGSANESLAAFSDNFECIDTFCSWKANEQRRALRKAENFQRLWENNTPKVEVISFPEAAARSLLKRCPNQPPIKEPDLLSKQWRLAEPGGSYQVDPDDAQPEKILKVELRQLQIDALSAWEKANHQGILAMATGAGKTITALACAASLNDLDIVFISVPTKELVQQWVQELAKHTTFPTPIQATGRADNWLESLYRKLRLIQASEVPDRRLPVICVGIYSELSKLRVVDLFADAGGLSEKSLLVADEVHAAGAKEFRRILRDDFTYRLGLSATPIRPHDEEGTEFLLEYFGGVVYEFTLEAAIAAGILCEYEYYVYVTPLTETEHERFQQLTKRIGYLLHSKDEEATDKAQRLKIQRARIIKSAASKLTILDRVIDDHPPRQGMIYCADINQATEASARLARRGVIVARYSSQDSDRTTILSQFARGYLDVLVAVKCLDEGVNIPAADWGMILASDTSQRQFIQRRGRILRTAPKKAIATLIDVLVVPPLGDEQVKLITSEVQRVTHFAQCASNRASVITKLVEELAYYGLTYSDLI